MKVLYYHRYAKSGFHIHAYSSTDIFYFADETLILFREQLGSFGGEDYSFTERQERLDEAKSIMQGSGTGIEELLNQIK
jgi:hypothetical protein